jgi:hypothetical protein
MSKGLSKPFIKLHVYLGGRSNTQVGPFAVAVEEAMQLLSTQGSFLRIVTDIKYCDDIRSLGWTPDDFADWMLSSDYHFVLTHVHQGLKHWNCEEVVSSLSRLKNHPGFPQGIELTCPIFLQDKKRYINGMFTLTNYTTF